MAAAARAMSSSLAVVLLPLLLLSLAEAYSFTAEWNAATPDSLNDWATKRRFNPQDILKFNLSGSDTVAQVKYMNEYQHCNSSNPIAAYDTSNSNVELDRSGPFYFVDKNSTLCQGGRRLLLVVISPRNRRPAAAPAGAPAATPAGAPASVPSTAFAPGLAPATAPSAAAFEGPAAAPTSGGGGLRGGGLLGAALGLLAWSLV